MLLRICNRFIPNCICKCYLSSPPNIDLNISAIFYLNNRLCGVNHNNNNIKSQMEIHLRKDNKRSRRWSSQWQSRDSRYADFEYSTIAAAVHTHTLSQERSFCLIWCQITRPWSKFTIRLFFAPFRPMPSPRHIVVYIAPKTPNQRKTKQNKTKKIGTNSTRIIGFYLDSSHTSKVYTHNVGKKRAKGAHLRHDI